VATRRLKSLKMFTRFDITHERDRWTELTDDGIGSVTQVRVTHLQRGIAIDLLLGKSFY